MYDPESAVIARAGQGVGLAVLPLHDDPAVYGFLNGYLCRVCQEVVTMDDTVVWQTLPMDESRYGRGREWVAHVGCIRELVEDVQADKYEQIRERILATGKAFPDDPDE